MRIDKAIRDFLIEIEIRKYTPKTIRSYRNNLSLFLRFCEEKAGIEDTEDISLPVIKQFVQTLSDSGRKGTYINSLLKTAKSFIQFCYEEGNGGFNTRKNFKWCKEDKPLIITFTDSQVRKMLKSCQGRDYISLRDTAILTILFETGIRCWELCCIKDEDIHDDFIIINGKNHKQRVVPVTGLLKRALLKYRDCRESYFAFKSRDDNLFLSFHGKMLTNSAVENILKRHGEGIEGVRVSPHTCRHFYAQQQVKMGTDLYTISRLLGHENIGITQTYLNSLKDKDIISIAKQKSVLMSI